MANVTVQSRVKPELKASADALFAAIGMSTADAIRIFLQQSVNENGLPFQPHAKRPNAETLAAMRELDSRKGKRYKNSQEMYKALEI
jgi:DNA-damage-inducible protein J